jgi:hypothetical protein
MSRKNIKISKPRKNTYAIVVDGETEVWYFQMLKRNEPSLQVNIEPKIPQKKKLPDQYKKVCELSEDYTKVFWVIDLDVIIAVFVFPNRAGKNFIRKKGDFSEAPFLETSDIIDDLFNRLFLFKAIIYVKKIIKKLCR